jgi:hypothetical protein
MKTYSELKKQHLSKRITEEEYQKEKADYIDSIVKQLMKEDVIIYKKAKQ